MKKFVPFTEFPTIDLLAEAQAEYTAARVSVNRDEDGVPQPFPPPTKRGEVFKPDDFKLIDAHAREVISLRRYTLLKTLCKLMLLVGI